MNGLQCGLDGCRYACQHQLKRHLVDGRVATGGIRYQSRKAPTKVLWSALSALDAQPLQRESSTCKSGSEAHDTNAENNIGSTVQIHHFTATAPLQAFDWHLSVAIRIQNRRRGVDGQFIKRKFVYFEKGVVALLPKKWGRSSSQWAA